MPLTADRKTKIRIDFWAERVMVDPDCGLGHVNREVAFGN